MSREIKAPPAKVMVSRSFDNKHVIEFNENSHRYKLDGQACTGVTTFLKGSLPTGQGLISWMKGQALEHLWNATVNQVVDLETKTELFKAAKAADRAKAQEAADVGTILHSLAESRSRGLFAEADALLEQAKAVEKWPMIDSCYQKYLAWETQNHGEFMEAESLIASPTHVFCGKFDLLSRRNGKIVLSDYKTSTSIYLEHKVQLAAYRLALREWSNIHVDAIEILRFSKTGGDFETELVDDATLLAELEQQAIRCKRTFDFLKEHEKKYEPK